MVNRRQGTFTSLFMQSKNSRSVGILINIERSQNFRMVMPGYMRKEIENFVCSPVRVTSKSVGKSLQCPMCSQRLVIRNALFSASKFTFFPLVLKIDRFD